MEIEWITLRISDVVLLFVNFKAIALILLLNKKQWDRHAKFSGYINELKLST